MGRKVQQRIPISDLISELHERLARIRQGDLHEIHSAPAPKQEEAAVTAPVIEERAAKRPSPKAETALCPICEESFPELKGRFRGRRMCRKCAADLRREFPGV